MPRISKHHRAHQRPGRRGAATKDVARVELGAQSYSSSSTLNGSPAVNMAIYRAPGANALETVRRSRPRSEAPVRSGFPEGISSTDGLRHHQVRALGDPRNRALTLLITFCLVVGVTFLFLQDWRATLIPVADHSGLAVGTFAALLALGLQRQHDHPVRPDPGDRPGGGRRHRGGRKRPAGHAGGRARPQGRGDQGHAPGDRPDHLHHPGAAGRFRSGGVSRPASPAQLYKQFAVTLSTAVLLSSLNALTLSPALCARCCGRRRPSGGGRWPGSAGYCWLRATAM
jgi:multidrug efflux pump subunit AcrB